MDGYASKVAVPTDLSRGTTCLDFLVVKFPHISRQDWLSRCADGLVLDEQMVPLEANDLVLPGSFIYYYRQVVDEADVPFEEQILYQDEHILVADKPHFLPVTPSGQYLKNTLLYRLRGKTGITSLSPVHRIDRDTAGLVLFSKVPHERGLYQKLFRERLVNKTYLAIAPFRKELSFPMHYQVRMEGAEHFMQMKLVEGEPNSESWIDILERRHEWAKYRIEIGTGKRHQIRLHMSSLGIPIQHDGIYPILTPQGVDYRYPLQLLASKLQWTDPLSGRPLEFESKFKLFF